MTPVVTFFVIFPHKDNVEDTMPLAPEYAAMLAEAAAAGAPPMTELSPGDARGMYQMMRPANPELAVGKVENLSIPGPAGDINARVYSPESAGPHPVLMNFHGGGWVIGDLETADGVSRDFCRTVGCVVVSVDYRLAPEHPYPAAPEDCVAATRWIAQNMPAVNGNGKLAVTGESAGANLAAVVCQTLSADVCFQLLAYPVVDHDLTRGSYSENGEGYLLDTNTMRWFWDLYCPDETKRSEPAASPLHTKSLAGQPPAMVVTAEFDPLRDEGKAYAEALSAAGVDTTYHCADGLIHDFFGTASLLTCSRPPFEAACAKLNSAFNA